MEGTNHFEINKRVWSFNFGWGTIMEKTVVSPTWKVVFDNKIKALYTLEGKLVNQEVQSLFLNEFETPKEAFTPPLETALKMLEQCNEKNFAKDYNNFYLGIKEKTNEIKLLKSKDIKPFGVKIISYDDARRIIKECRENNINQKEFEQNNFNKFELRIGRKVWSFNFGWGKIIYKEDSNYPWIVEFEDKTKRSYTTKGKREENERQSLFLNEFKVPEITNQTESINLTILSEIVF